MLCYHQNTKPEIVTFGPTASNTGIQGILLEAL